MDPHSSTFKLRYRPCKGKIHTNIFSIFDSFFKYLCIYISSIYLSSCYFYLSIYLSNLKLSSMTDKMHPVQFPLLMGLFTGFSRFNLCLITSFNLSIYLSLYWSIYLSVSMSIHIFIWLIKIYRISILGLLLFICI